MPQNKRRAVGDTALGVPHTIDESVIECARRRVQEAAADGPIDVGCMVHEVARAVTHAWPTIRFILTSGTADEISVDECARCGVAEQAVYAYATTRDGCTGFGTRKCRDERAGAA